MNKKIIISILLIISILGTTILFLTINKKGKTESVAKEYIELFNSEKVYINGIINSSEICNIYLDSQYNNIVETYVSDRDHVNEGQVLFKCKNETIETQIEQYNDQIVTYNVEISNNNESIEKLNNKIKIAKNEIKKINSNKSSEEDELKNESISDGYLNEIKTYEEQIDTLNSQIKESQKNISNTKSKISELSEKEYKEIKASVSGTVYLQSNNNDITSPYMVIYSDELVIKGQVDEKNKEKIAVGQDVEIKIIANNKVFSGVIKSISDLPSEKEVELSKTDSLNNFDVEVNFDNTEEISKGYHVQCIIKERQEQIEIPEEAVVYENNEYYVYKEVDGKVNKSKITCEKSEKDGYFYVLSGVSENDKVIKNIEEYLKAGKTNE